MQFQPWSELLDRYVDGQGLVNYQGMTTRSTQITDWLEELSQINPNLLNFDRQLALWLNLYNALVIQQVLENYPLESILPKFFGIPNWLAFWRFFSRSIYTINGHSYSLNNIEHDILRQKFFDPRLHFALVCASIGCPLLRNEAYLGDRLETQLEEDAKRFINNRDKVYYDSNSHVLYCSKIFKWYEQDFLRVSKSISQYIQIYLSVDIPDHKPVTIQYLDYDWSLNQRISS